MPAGLQTFDASGNLILEISDRVYRVLTIIQVPTTDSGSVTVPELLTGTPVLQAVQLTEGRRAPALSITGGTNVNWNYAGVGAGDRDSNFHLMVAVF